MEAVAYLQLTCSSLQLPYTTDPIFSLSKVHSVSGVLAQQEYIQTLAY